LTSGGVERRPVAWSGLSGDVWRRRAASGSMDRVEMAWSGLMWREVALAA